MSFVAPKMVPLGLLIANKGHSLNQVNVFYSEMENLLVVSHISQQQWINILRNPTLDYYLTLSLISFLNLNINTPFISGLWQSKPAVATVRQQWTQVQGYWCTQPHPVHMRGLTAFLLDEVSCGVPDDHVNWGGWTAQSHFPAISCSFIILPPPAHIHWNYFEKHFLLPSLFTPKCFFKYFVKNTLVGITANATFIIHFPQKHLK